MMPPGELNSAGVIGRPVPYTTSRRPLRQTVWSRLVARQRAEVAQQERSARRASGNVAAIRRAADHRALDELAGLGALLEGLLERRAVLVV